VRRILEEREAEIVHGRVEGQENARAVRLGEHALAAGKERGTRIAVAAHAAQRAEVVVERAVLLHEEDDVLDVVDGAAAVVRGYRQGFLDAGGQRSGGCRGAEITEKRSAVGRHFESPL
jgi:hypothetical protein